MVGDIVPALYLLYKGSKKLIFAQARATHLWHAEIGLPGCPCSKHSRPDGHSRGGGVLRHQRILACADRGP